MDSHFSENRRPNTEDRLSNIEDHLSDVENNLSDVENNLSNVENNLSDVENRLSDVEGPITTIQAHLEDRPNPVQGGLTGVEDNLHVLASAGGPSSLSSIFFRVFSFLFQRVHVGNDHARSTSSTAPAPVPFATPRMLWVPFLSLFPLPPPFHVASTERSRATLPIR
ncbi:uncharacterized protein BXZ73DRAFT_106829 [Epithele typhae]|uniref:uncharacterized protein n=1 Tax=Epithele typhae TaxID=378194 RepID=UPI002007FBCF|nr:uncharacterized protein BXZ73DRAFT_106829 [Epithele typhae]KAH9913809.1 hypothetical protein BXZ73DRAFT_106829 [Epithele typhae]